MIRSSRCDHGVVRLTDEDFRAAWPRVVRALASWSGSLDDAEEYAAEAFARAVDRDEVDDLAAWCVSVAKRAWIDDHRRREVFTRIAPDLVTGEAMPADNPPDPPHDVPDELDDRVALLFVACDEALAPGARMVLALRVVCGLTIAQTAMHLGIQDSAAAARLTRAKRALAQARGEFRVPDADRAEPPAPGRARLRRGHVHRRAPLRTGAARCPLGHGATGAVDRRRARGDVPRGHRGPWAAGRRTTRAGAPPGTRRGRRRDDPRRGRPRPVGPGPAARRDGGRSGRGAGRRPVRPRGGDLGAAQRRAVVRADRLGPDRAALRSPGTGVAVSFGECRAARRPGAARASRPR